MSLDSLLHRRRPTVWEEFLSSPYLFIARRAYTACQDNSKHQTSSDRIRVVCISDTHNAHESLSPLPSGDVLVHAGDLTQSGSPKELAAALVWLSAQPHAHKLFIAGNHDTALADPASQTLLHTTYPDLTYLEDSYVALTIRGRTVTFYGNPNTPRHGSWPFQYPRISFSQVSSSQLWSSIPPQTDVLVTHGPPAYHLDLGGKGCVALLHAVRKLRPKLHVFGHIHDARGIEYVRWTDAQMAYENICAGVGGWWSLLPILRALLVRLLPRTLCGEEDTGTGGTVMVNAAVVCGLRDEFRREAIVVDI